MPYTILIKATQAGFFNLYIDDLYVGTYGNPVKAMHVAMAKLGYTLIEEEV